MRFTIILALCFIGAASAGSLNKREAATFYQTKDPYELIYDISEGDPEVLAIFKHEFELFYYEFVSENNLTYLPEVPRRYPDEGEYVQAKDPFDLVDNLKKAGPETFAIFKHKFEKFVDELKGSKQSINDLELSKRCKVASDKLLAEKAALKLKDPYELINSISEDFDSFPNFMHKFELFYYKFVSDYDLLYLPEVPRRYPDDEEYVQPKDPFDLVNNLKKAGPETFDIFKYKFEKFFDEWKGAKQYINDLELSKRCKVASDKLLAEKAAIKLEHPYDLIDSISEGDSKFFATFKYEFELFYYKFVSEHNLTCLPEVPRSPDMNGYVQAKDPYDLVKNLEKGSPETFDIFKYKFTKFVNELKRDGKVRDLQDLAMRCESHANNSPQTVTVAKRAINPLGLL